MSRFSFTNSVMALLARSRRPRQARPHNGLTRTRFTPRLEILEGRLTPSTLTTVTSAADDGSAGTLRAVITAASAGSTIMFDPSLNGKTITLSQGPINLGKSLVIDGPGASLLSVSGNSASRVIGINGSTTNVTLENLTITKGKANTGGAVVNHGILLLSNCILSNNQATGSSADLPQTSPEGGGAILNLAGANLTVANTTLIGNIAHAVNKNIDVFGGGLLNEGSATVSSSTFTGNKALGGGGGSTFFGASSGGAIDNFGGATLNVTGSNFGGNQAIGDPSTGGGMGGAIENNSGFGPGLTPATANPSTATISNCSFSSNLVGGGYGSGGAIENEGTDAQMTLRNSTVGNNRCQPDGSNGSNGGGIMNDNLSNLNIINCNVFGNLAEGSSAGVGISNGGGIENRNARMSISGSTIVGNQDIGGDNATVTTGGQGDGGGIMNSSGGTLVVNNSTIAGNLAQGGMNGTTSGNPRNSQGSGGGIMNLNGATLYLYNSTLRNNVAEGGSTIIGIGGTGFGGGIRNDGSTLTMVGDIVTGNVASGGNGGSGFGGGFGSGGGLEDTTHQGSSSNPPVATANIMNSTFSSNSTIGGNGGSGAAGGTGVGRGIDVGFYSLTIPGFLDMDTVTMNKTTLVSNIAIGGNGGDGGNGGNGLGGGIAIQAGSSSTVSSGTTITFNEVDGGIPGTGGSNGQGVGGGVYALGTFTFDASTVLKKNHASTSNDDIYP